MACQATETYALTAELPFVQSRPGYLQTYDNGPVLERDTTRLFSVFSWCITRGVLVCNLLKHHLLMHVFVRYHIIAVCSCRELQVQQRHVQLILKYCPLVLGDRYLECVLFKSFKRCMHFCYLICKAQCLQRICIRCCV